MIDQVALLRQGPQIDGGVTHWFSPIRAYTKDIQIVTQRVAVVNTLARPSSATRKPHESSTLC
ncbi:hypothetical protein THICB2_480040 [Thiomonas sp. CB2]|nr:hypothetical protein THICB2_480040 [Thiomonas sp. CB2]VDY04387.1 protein of unknown function [Thiomonas sp. Bio17B3]VDY08442.1 protein of unknown function [Thiomonas sp. Sup16B3]VDY12638.1 conserved protein of unknown function [Thiomonas sp. OC7]VDY18152.1 protein of unknown function [Thiomonas sp. CB2]